MVIGSTYFLMPMCLTLSECTSYRGFNQQPEVNFHETFSLVVKSTNICVVLSLVMIHKWPIPTNVPPGFIDPHTGPRLSLVQVLIQTQTSTLSMVSTPFKSSTFTWILRVQNESFSSHLFLSRPSLICWFMLKNIEK